jgi:tricorn protease
MVQFLTALCLAFQAPGNVGYYMEPSLHGNDLVFEAEGDIWRVPVTGGNAVELTSHVAPASHPALSPDGKWVAYTGTYDGTTDAYAMPVEGGVPTRLTYGGGAAVVGWSPDGKVLFSTSLHSGLPGSTVSAVDRQTLRQSAIPLDKVTNGCYDASGRTFYFTRFPFQGSNTKRYKGGTAQSIWKYSNGAAEAVPLTTNFTGTSKNPMVSGERVFFLSDRDGVMNVWSMDNEGKSLKEITHSKSWDVQSATLDGGRIAFHEGADIHLVDLDGHGDHVIPITLSSDFDQSREHFVANPAQYISASSLSADGSKIALTARGQVFSIPTEPGRIVDITKKSSVRYRDGLYMPDGKSVLALSDESGEMEWWQMPANGVGPSTQISHDSKVLTMSGDISPDGKHLAYADKNSVLWILDIATHKSTKVVSDLDGEPHDFAWSPDSQWLAFNLPQYTFDRVALYSLSTGTVTPITTTRANSESPAWSADGKWLFFLSERTFQSTVGSPWGPRAPEPYFDRQSKIYMVSLQKGLRSPFLPNDELHPATPAVGPQPAVNRRTAARAPAKPSTESIDLDGIQDRLWEVPIPAGNYSDLSAASDKLFVLSRQRGGGELSAVTIANKDVALRPFAAGVSGYSLSKDRQKILLATGNNIFVVPAGAPVAALEKPVDLSGWTFAVNPREEWRQMFNDAWRLERDYFYDTNMHGVAWSSIRAKYLPLVDRIRDRSELSNLLAQMVAELSALHTFVYGGDEQHPAESVAPAYLGAELSRVDSEGGYRVDKIYSGEPDYPNTMAPLARPDVDVQVGDVITSIDGVSVLSAPNLDSLLRAKAGRQVLVSVKEKGTGSSRECIVVPISAGEFSNLRYTDWEYSRRQAVETESKGSVGYVHLRAMTNGDIAQWERDFYPAFDRQGLIIDVRHNNGGNIDSWIIERVLRKAWMYWQDRVGNPTWNMQWAFRGHIVVLCDENTASDGEAFTEGIKRLGLGKVIGTRTWGGEIWLSSSNVLEDMGIATAAETGVYGPEGRWLIEGHGVDPDITVDNLPHATFLGHDAQLDAALDYLAKEIKDHPIPVPPSPKHPIKSFPPSQGGL